MLHAFNLRGCDLGMLQGSVLGGISAAGLGMRPVCRSEPGFAVGEVVVAAVLVEELFEGGGDLSGVVSGEAAGGARGERHAIGLPGLVHGMSGGCCQ